MSDEPEYALVMPFVTCASNGGPHDDSSYVAGWEMGALDAALKHASALNIGPRPTLRTSIHADNQPQADLIAMKHGFHVVFEEIDGHPDWMHAEFMEQGAAID